MMMFLSTPHGFRGSALTVCGVLLLHLRPQAERYRQAVARASGAVQRTLEGLAESLHPHLSVIVRHPPTHPPIRSTTRCRTSCAPRLPSALSGP